MPSILHAVGTFTVLNLLPDPGPPARHAVVEQRIAELKSAGLAHLPSG